MTQTRTRGIGPAQQHILNILLDLPPTKGMFIAQLSEKTGLSKRRTAAAVAAMKKRGLVWTEMKCTGWTGYGEIGKLRRSDRYRNDDSEKVVTLNGGDPWPWKPDTHVVGHGHSIDVVKPGMPTRSLAVFAVRQVSE